MYVFDFFSLLVLCQFGNIKFRYLCNCVKVKRWKRIGFCFVKNSPNSVKLICNKCICCIAIRCCSCKVMGVTKKRTFVKTAIYRVWILITSYIFLSIVGKSWSDSIIPTLTLNFLYSIGYYTYDRIWQNIKWGIKK